MNINDFELIKNFAEEKTKFYKNKTGNFLERDELFEFSPPMKNDMINGDMKGFIFSSGGTEGKSKYALYSREDFDIMTDILAFILKSGGINENDRVANVFIAGNLWTSFLVVNEALKKINCLNFPIAGNSSPETIAKYLEKFKINAIIGLPTLIIKIAETCKKLNLNTSIEKILYGGEHFYESQKEFIKRIWPNAAIKSAGYATVDTGPVGYQCSYCEGTTHHILEDFVHFELIDENENFIKEYGKTGEIVITDINRFKMPIIRFKTGDLGQYVDIKCKCGYSGKSFRLLGRKSDMIVVGSTNLELSAFDKTVSNLKDSNGIWQIVIKNENGKDFIEFNIEMIEISKEKPFNIIDKLKEIAENIKYGVENGWLNIKVNFLSPGEIKRNPKTGKVKKVVDLRKL
jgi:phenylacetate-coenzyme A ligase PaaK-like adenylate-forming protein